MSSSRTITWDVNADSHPTALESYLQAMSDFFVVSGISPHDQAHFRNTSRATMSPSGVLGTGQCVGQTLERSSALLKRSGADGLTLFVNKAATEGNCAGQAFKAAPGTLQFRDLSQPSLTHFENIDATIVMIPKHLLPDPLLKSSIHGMCLSPDRADVKLISLQMAALISQAERLSDAVLATSVQALLLVVARMVEQSGDHSTEPEIAVVQNAVRAAAGHFIEQRLKAREGRLDIAATLRVVGVSRATLYRAFNGEGGVRRYHQDRRLHHARVALGQRSGPSPSIAEIADDYGFASPSHFSRLFKQRYGFAPSAVTAARHTDDPTPSNSMRHHLMSDWLAHIRNA